VTRGVQKLPAQLLEALALAGTWVGRSHLVEQLPGRSPVAVEGALADLVSTGQAQYRANVGYRLAGALEARMAAKVAKVEGLEVAGVLGGVGSSCAIGVAQDFGDEGLVTYAEPVPLGGEEAALQRLREIGVAHVARLDQLLHKPRQASPLQALRLRLLRVLREEGKPLGAYELAVALDLCVWEVTPALGSAESAHLVAKGRDGCYRLTDRIEFSEVVG
jgi:hypothetical protein